jgi:hypothetical protein
MSKNVVMIILALAVVLLLCFYLQSLVVKQLTPEPTIYDNSTTKSAPSAPAAGSQSSTKTKISAPTKSHH